MTQGKGSRGRGRGAKASSSRRARSRARGGGAGDGPKKCVGGPPPAPRRLPESRPGVPGVSLDPLASRDLASGRFVSPCTEKCAECGCSSPEEAESKECGCDLGPCGYIPPASADEKGETRPDASEWEAKLNAPRAAKVSRRRTSDGTPSQKRTEVILQKQWCDRCDGCGWFEGGDVIKTECNACGGTGVVYAEVPKPRPRLPRKAAPRREGKAPPPPAEKRERRELALHEHSMPSGDTFARYFCSCPFVTASSDGKITVVEQFPGERLVPAGSESREVADGPLRDAEEELAMLRSRVAKQVVCPNPVDVWGWCPDCGMRMHGSRHTWGAGKGATS